MREESTSEREKKKRGKKKEERKSEVASGLSIDNCLKIRHLLWKNEKAKL